MSLTKCPKCEAETIFLDDVSYGAYMEFYFDGTLVDRKLPLVCWSVNDGVKCNQKFWVYSRTGRITRRNK